MKPIYTENEFKLAKATDLLLLECHQCHKQFGVRKSHLQVILAGRTNGHRAKYCSIECVGASQSKKIATECDQCHKIFFKTPTRLKKTKHHFCSQRCSGLYHNAHRKYGYRRSKLEVWLEAQLKEKYPNLEIHFNSREAINSELDIYFPSMRLAFELNGIFHYEPIHGLKTLSQVQNNDERKFQACIEKGIELCIMDTADFRYFKPIKAIKYLNIITEIIENKIKKTILIRN